MQNIGLASPDKIIHTLASFSGKPASQWLPTTHPCKTGQILTSTSGKKPIQTLNKTRRTYTDNELIDTVTVNGPNHCIDGWSFLSRAFSALIEQDLHACRHLAYYAQLRASLGILSCAGIGIFNGLNVVIDKNGGVHKLENNDEHHRGSGTHNAVWEAIEAWANIEENAKYFLDSAPLNGITFSECIDSIWPSQQSSSIVAPIINNWGLDLRFGAKDHKRRNISSYAPHEFNQISTNFIEDMAFVREIWELMQPSSTNGYTDIDVFLLRNILHTVHQTHHAGPNRNRPINEGALKSRYDQLDPSIQSYISKTFILSTSDIPDLISFATKENDDPKTMIARAVLLLRISTGFVQRAFSEAGFSTDGTSAHPWLEPIGIAKGFWSSNSGICEPMASLWDEVQYSLEDLDTSLSGSPADTQAWYATGKTGWPQIIQTERVAMWGLCP